VILISSLTALFQQPASKAPTGIDVSIWKWVIIIGVSAIIIFYGIKRISEIVVKRKTDMMIRDVVEEKKETEDDGLER
jgi:ATP/ADP translocase